MPSSASDVPPGQLALPVAGCPQPATQPQIRSIGLNSLQITVTVAAIQVPRPTPVSRFPLYPPIHLDDPNCLRPGEVPGRLRALTRARRHQEQAGREGLPPAVHSRIPQRNQLT